MINDNILGWSNPLRSNVKTAHPVFGLFRCLWSVLYSYLNQITPERTTFSAVLVRLFGAHQGSGGSIHTYSNKSLFESNQTCQMRTHPKSSLNLVVILLLLCLQVAFLNACTHSTCRDGVCCIYCELKQPWDTENTRLQSALLWWDSLPSLHTLKPFNIVNILNRYKI